MEQMTKEELAVILAGIRKLNVRINRHMLLLERAARKAGSSGWAQSTGWLGQVNHGRYTEKSRTLSQLDGDWE